MPQPIRIEIYSRPGCHLCDDAETTVRAGATGYDVELSVVNIEDDPALEARYGTEIPVVFINGELVFRYRVDKSQLERKLREQWNT